MRRSTLLSLPLQSVFPEFNFESVDVDVNGEREREQTKE
jgi:hypothetical protein